MSRNNRIDYHTYVSKLKKDTICPRCRKEISSKWLRDNPDPSFNNQICYRCARAVKWAIDQQQTADNKLGLSIQEARSLVIAHYGNVCNCCGEDEILFLEIDHVNNDGAAHRKAINRADVCIWIVNNNYPNEFQILCANCNHGKYRNKGVCPHKIKLRAVI